MGNLLEQCCSSQSKLPDLQIDIEDLKPRSSNLEYFIKLLKATRDEASQRFHKREKEYIRDRRRALKDGNNEAYEKIVIEQNIASEQVYNQAITDILKHLGLDMKQY